MSLTSRETDPTSSFSFRAATHFAKIGQNGKGTLRVAEVYRSVQGEGLLTGTDCAFVRTTGCNLRCWFCDTPYASWFPEGEDLPIDVIDSRLDAWDCRHVVVTGGEPMLHAGLIPFCKGLHASGYHVTIETAGTVYLPVPCDLMSLSPKLSNSTPDEHRAPRWRERHDRTRYAPDVVRRLVSEYTYQVKFVVGQPDDCREVERYLEGFPEIQRDRVMLMPMGTEACELELIGAWLEDYCRQHGLRFCPRRQIEWFGLAKGT